MITCRDDIGHLPIQPIERTGNRLPHLPAGLVQHLAVTNDILVLLHQVARAKHRLDMQLIDVVGDPSRAQIEQRLIDVILDIPLGISQKNHRKRLRIRQLLAIRPVLCHRKEAHTQ